MGDKMKARLIQLFCITITLVFSSITLGDYSSRKRILILSWNCEASRQKDYRRGMTELMDKIDPSDKTTKTKAH